MTHARIKKIVHRGWGGDGGGSGVDSMIQRFMVYGFYFYFGNLTSLEFSREVWIQTSTPLPSPTQDPRMMLGIYVALYTFDN